MTATITIEPDCNWLEQVQTELLDNLTNGQLADLAHLVINDMETRAGEDDKDDER